MKTEAVLDVSGLPHYAYGQRSILWWGTLGFCLIEGTAFALALVAYFYLRGKTETWPPGGIKPPDLFWGTLNTVILLASCIPNRWVKAAAEREQLRPVRLWLVVCLVFGLAFIHYLLGGLEIERRYARHDDNELAQLPRAP